MITDGLNPLSALVFVGAVLAGLALIGGYALARFRGRPDLARIALRIAAAGAGTYALVLVIMGFASRNRVLALGEEKRICELDCHLAYSVAAVNTTPLDSGVRYVVTVRVRFDGETISAHRPGDLALSPNSRYVALEDAEGRRYPGSTDGLERRLVPGESYTTDLAFEVPAGVQARQLILRSNDLPTRLLIGHENSLFHGQTTFALGS